MPGLPELIVIGCIVLLFFGHRLPILGRALGESVHEFKDGLAGEEDVPAEVAADEPQPKALGYTPDE